LNKVEKDKLYRVYVGDNEFIGIGIRNSLGFKMEKLLIQR
jgi:tRNA pseudouridine55 synthase